MRAMVENMPFSNKRSGQDRRKEKILFFNKYWLMGKRGAPRREQDRLKRHLVEWHGSKTFAMILTIILLSTFDAILTLDLISRGAKEINPVMAYYINISPLIFFGVKYLLTCTSVVIILLYSNAYLFKTRIQAKILFLFLIIPFALVVRWELHLLNLVSG